jgi:hypothetical protein
MIDIHSAALERRVSSYHEFLARYSRRTKVVYGFVEGKDDPAFYRGFIDLMLPDSWQVELWAAGNKVSVYEIHRLMDWRRFPKKRICFFVDRDLTDILRETLTLDSNIYITSGYSIETDLVNGDVCKRMLTELYGLAAVAHEELERVGCLFESELDRFCQFLAPVMAWIVVWRHSGKRPSLNNILMRDLFRFSNASIEQVPTPRGQRDWAAYVHAQCGVSFDPTVDITPVQALFNSASNRRRLARGKYLLWFLIEFCRAACRSAPQLFSGVHGIPKPSVQLSLKNAMSVVGPRARMPSSLREFLEKTFLAFITRVEGRQQRPSAPRRR